MDGGSLMDGLVEGLVSASTNIHTSKMAWLPRFGTAGG